MENLTNAEDLNKRTLVAQAKIKAGGKDALEAHFKLNKLADESENVRDEAELENAQYDKKRNQKLEIEINDKVESDTLEHEGNEQKEEMKFLQKTLQECYEGKLKFFDLWNKESQELIMKHLEEISQNKNVSINIPEALQSEYNRRISNGYIDVRQGDLDIKYLAQEKNVNLILNSNDLQHGYEELLMKGWSTNKIEELAKNNNIKLEINEEFLQKALDNILKKLKEGDDRDTLDSIWELSKEKGIDLKVNQNMIDENPPIDGELRFKYLKGFFSRNNIQIDIKTVPQDEEARQEQNNSKDIFRNITSYGKKENIYPEEFESKIQAEETYIKLIHDINTAHVEGPRKKILENLSSYNSDLDYKKVVKMDYLEYLKVPDDQRLKVEKIITIDNIPVVAIFYCKKEKTPIAGKFILGVNDKNEIKLVFDATMGEHRDIGAKYDLEVLGGGWIKIDEENKRIGIFSQSSDFGIEPRQITEKIVSESFTGYEIFIGKKEN